MGMAASQARLLSITARIHDVEYQAQSIQSAKVQLATQSDEAYEEYLAALDATTLTIKDYEGNVITANFNNLCGQNRVMTGKQYALRTSDNKLIVSDKMMDEYENFMEAVGKKDPYAFALYVMGYEDYSAIEKAKSDVYGNHEENVTLSNLQKSLEEMGDYSKLIPEEQKEYDSKKETLEYQLYKAYAGEIYANVSNEDEEDFDQDAFNYYVEQFKLIESVKSEGGSYISISDYDGIDSDTANDSDWLQNMIRCGKITLEIINTDKKTGEVSLGTTSPSSDTYIDYTTTTTIDKTALAKAEAEYEHAMKQIDKKDKKFDMDLSKLETERTALTTEYDSVKKVITDNIERTFGIFS